MSVFPVPGGPVRRTPLGILAPTFTKRSGASAKQPMPFSPYARQGLKPMPKGTYIYNYILLIYIFIYLFVYIMMLLM